MYVSVTAHFRLANGTGLHVRNLGNWYAAPAVGDVIGGWGEDVGRRFVVESRIWSRGLVGVWWCDLVAVEVQDEGEKGQADAGA